MLILATSLVCGLLPGFAWLVFYLDEDSHAEPERLVIFTFLAGMAFGFFAIAMETGLTSALDQWNISEFSIGSLFLLALIEESLKFAAAHFAAAKSPAFKYPIDAMIYTIIAALGFATLENIGAISNLSWNSFFIPSLFETLSFRFVGATLLHSLTSGIVGYHWAMGILRGKVKRYLVLGLTLAAVLHGIFNYLILHYGNGAYTLALVIAIGFFVLSDFEKLKESPQQTIPATADR